MTDAPSPSPPPPPPGWKPADPCPRTRRRFALTPSEWDFARERFRLAPDAIPPSPPNTAPPMAELIASALKSLDLPTVQQVAELAPHWQQIVGDLLAKHSRPAAIHNGTLLVAVDHPAFLSRFRGRATSAILDYVQAIAPALHVTALRATVQN